MKLISLVCLGLVLCGCEPRGPNYKERINNSILCLNGVQYYSFDSKLAPVFNQDSTVRTCEE